MSRERLAQILNKSEPWRPGALVGLRGQAPSAVELRFGPGNKLEVTNALQESLARRLLRGSLMPEWMPPRVGKWLSRGSRAALYSLPIYYLLRNLFPSYIPGGSNRKSVERELLAQLREIYGKNNS
jgi:hypothetical protein